MTSKRINEIRLQNLIDIKEEKSLKIILQEYCPQLSADEIKTILQLRNNNTVINIIEDKNFIYELIGIINDIGYSRAIKPFITDKKEIKPESFFSLDIYDKERAKYLDDIKKLREKIQLSNGKQCRKCGNKNTVTNEAQRSSGDEGAKVINFCVDCQLFF
jgi:DNA-directed RNA polymerase subunit M/transcription elongation factor TFIIS